MLNRGQLVLNNFLKPIKILFEQRNVPNEPWTEEQIEFLLQTLSNMDTDKDDKAARVGDRLKCVSCNRQLEVGDVVFASIATRRHSSSSYRCLYCASKYNLITINSICEKIKALIRRISKSY